MILRDQRADLRRRIQRVADAHGAHPRREPLEEGRLDGAMHEHARAVRADLAGGIEVTEQRAADGVLEDGVIEDDERRFAAELERHLLQRGGRIRHDRFARPDLAGQGDLADLGVCGEQAAGVRHALHDLKHALRQPRLAENLAQPHGRERGQLGGLEDHGIAAGECRRRFPTGDLQRIVPGADARDDAERLAPRIAECLRPEVQVLAREGGGEARIVFEAVGSGEHIDRARLLDRLAGIARLEHGQLDVAGAENVGGTPQHPAAFDARKPRPLLLRRRRPGDRRRDLRRTVDRDLGQHFAGRGVDRLEGFRTRAARAAVEPARGGLAGAGSSSAAADFFSRLSTKAVSNARALSLSASCQRDNAARSQTPSIMAAIIAARLRASSAGNNRRNAWRRFDSMRLWYTACTRLRPFTCRT